MKRDLTLYFSVLDKLTKHYNLFKNQGLEGWMFCVDDDLLKIYQSFIISSLTLEEELRLWRRQEELLSIYAPSIDAKVMCLLGDGTLAPLTRSNEAVCFGVRMRKAIPFQTEVWDTLILEDKRSWARKIGRQLGEFHKSAPLVKTSHKYDDERQLWFETVLDAVMKYSDRSSGLQLSLLRNSSDRLHDLIRQAASSNNIQIPVVHGDLNLSNIILTVDNCIEFIDCGPSLPLGAGIERSGNWMLDNWWDVAIMSKHLVENSGKTIADDFLDSYMKMADSKFTDRTLLSYWNVMVYLLVIAVCLRRWEDFSDKDNGFNRFLLSRQLSLENYVNFYIYRILDTLAIYHPENSPSVF